MMLLFAMIVGATYLLKSAKGAMSYRHTTPYTENYTAEGYEVQCHISSSSR